MLQSSSFAQRIVYSLCTVIAILSAAPSQAAGNDIVVGQIFDQSPAWVEAGRDYAAGAKTYFDVINSTGGVNGHRIVYVTRDSNGTPAEVRRIATELISDAKVDVLFGPIGDAASRALADLGSPELNAAVVFGPLTGLPQGKPSMLSLRARYDDEARELVRHFKGLGLTSFCLVTTTGEVQSAAARAVREALAATSQTPGCEAMMDEAGREAAAIAKTIAARRPQAVIVLGDTSVLGNFAREFPFKQLGILLGGLSLVNHTALMEIAGPQVAKGIVLTQVVPSPQRLGVPIVAEHVKAMKKFRDEPPSHLTLEGFMAAKQLVESLRAGLNAKLIRREDVAAALLKRHAQSAISPAATDIGMVNTGGGKLVDVTMVRGDGTLIR